MAGSLRPSSLILNVANARWAPIRAARITSQQTCVRSLTTDAQDTAPVRAIRPPVLVAGAGKPVSAVSESKGRVSCSTRDLAVRVARTIPRDPLDRLSGSLRAKRLRDGTFGLRIVVNWLFQVERIFQSLPEDAAKTAPGRWINHERCRVMREALEEFAAVPGTLKEARVMLDMMKEEKVVPSSKGLTVYLKTLMQKCIAEGGSGPLLAVDSTESAARTTMTGGPKVQSIHLQDLRHMLNDVLSLRPYLDIPLLTTVLTAHVRIGTPTLTILETIQTCMDPDGTLAGAVGGGSKSTWPPMLFGIMIQAYRRDGDMKGAMQWFLAYRRVRREIVTRGKTGSISDGKLRSGSEGEVSKERTSGITRLDVEAERWSWKSLAWPYAIFFDAASDIQSTRAGLLGSRSGLVTRLLACIRQDGLEPTPRLFSAMIQHARMRRCRTEAVAAWNGFVESREMSRREPNLGPFLEILKTMRGESLAKAKRLPLGPILSKLFPAGVGNPTRRNLLQTTEPKIAQAILTQLTVLALSPAYLDFQLAHKLVRHFGSGSTGFSPRSVDAVAAAMLHHLIDRTNSAGWQHAVFGKGAMLIGTASRHHAKRRFRRRNRIATLNRPTLAHWDFLASRLAEVETEMAAGSDQSRASLWPPGSRNLVVPTDWPLARLSDVPAVLRERRSSVSVTTHTAIEARSSRRERGEAEMHDRAWMSLKELMRRAAMFGQVASI